MRLCTSAATQAEQATVIRNMWPLPGEIAVVKTGWPAAVLIQHAHISHSLRMRQHALMSLCNCGLWHLSTTSNVVSCTGMFGLTWREGAPQEPTQHSCTDAAQNALTGGWHSQCDHVPGEALAAVGLASCCAGSSNQHSVQHTTPCQRLAAGQKNTSRKNGGSLTLMVSWLARNLKAM